MENQITKTEVQGISASAILEKFDNLESKIDSFKESLKPKPKTEYITRKEVSEMFGVSLVTVNDWSKKNILTAYKIANKVRYKRHEVEAALIQKG